MERSRLQVRFWGVRGSIPTPGPATAGVGGNTPCVEVLAPGQREALVIDAGTGIREYGAALGARERPPDAVHLLLSHFHWDHIQGLPFFAPLYAPATGLCIRAAAAAADLQRVLAAQMSAPCFPVDWSALGPAPQLAALDGTTRIADLQVTAFPLHHPQGCSGFRIERDGAVIVYASDCELGHADLDEVLERHCQGADVLICDAQHTVEEAPQRRGWGHSSWLDAVRLAARAAVGELVLFHHDPGHGDAQLEAILGQARRHFAATRLAREGESVSA